MMPNPTISEFPDEAASPNPGHITAVVGSNFSGRSRFLKTRAGLEHHGAFRRANHDDLSVYIRPEVDLSISGLRPTTGAEVSYHLGENQQREGISQLLRVAGLADRLEQNPTTLSGGEQSALVFISKLGLNPSVLAVDCALEQLHPTLKDQLLTEAKRGEFSRTTFLLADNRLAECAVPMDASLESPFQQMGGNDDEKQIPLAPLDSSVTLPLNVNPISIELNELTFAYKRGNPVLRDISGKLTPGTIHVIRGRNGAGKSTLAKLLCGVLRCPSGSIKCGGRAVMPYYEPGRITAYHFQFADSQFVARTVGEDVASGPAARGLAGTTLAARVDAILAAFGLSALKEAEIFDLPYVLRKRVAIAATVATGAQWMIFDEPTLGQDEQSCRSLAAILSQLTSLGIGVIAISHSRFFVGLLKGQEHYLEDGIFKPMPKEVKP